MWRDGYRSSGRHAVGRELGGLEVVFFCQHFVAFTDLLAVVSLRVEAERVLDTHVQLY